MFLYDISAFMLYFVASYWIFSMNFVLFYEIFYNDDVAIRHHVDHVTMTSLIFWPILIKIAQHM